MIFLLILWVAVIWVVVLYLVGYLLTFFIKPKWIRHVAGLVVLMSLFTWPLRDEMEGEKEFEALCKTGGVYQISPSAVGKKFDLSFSSTALKPLSGFVRPVEETTIIYTDVASGEVIATAKGYSAKGGWLVRKGWLRNSGGGDGAFLGRDQCFPPSNLEQELRLTAIKNKVVN
jgi:hypothetical protein